MERAKPPAHEGGTRDTAGRMAAANPEAHVEGATARAAARSTPRPANPKELDVVMDRITRRISEMSGGPANSGHRATASEAEETPRGTTASTTRPPVRKPAAAERVHLNWTPTIIWPSALVPDKTTAADPSDGTVRLKWSSLNPR